MADGFQDSMKLMCSKCGNGFTEAIATTQSSFDVHQTQRMANHNGETKRGYGEEDEG